MKPRPLKKEDVFPKYRSNWQPQMKPADVIEVEKLCFAVEWLKIEFDVEYWTREEICQKLDEAFGEILK